MSESYGVVVAVVALGLVGLIGAFALNKALTVTYPTEGKLKTYESGVDPVGEGWAQVHIRYYLFAYLYVIFAVDARNIPITRRPGRLPLARKVSADAAEHIAPESGGGW